MTENKPKEFWIKWFSDDDIAVYSSKPKFDIDTHVIEIEAIEQLQKENEELKEQLSDFEGLYQESKKMRSEIAALKSKLKIAVEALEWYSDKNNLDLSESVIMEDGAKAEQALTEIGEI